MPRFSARRSIPAHAVPLKKNRCGIEPFSSTCDNEHTAASLGQGEKLGVEESPRHCSFGSIHSTSVRPFAPWWDNWYVFACKTSNQAAEGVGSVAEDSRHVLVKSNNWRLAVLSSDVISMVE